jgi:hypothetical protein
MGTSVSPWLEANKLKEGVSVTKSGLQYRSLKQGKEVRLSALVCVCATRPRLAAYTAPVYHRRRRRRRRCPACCRLPRHPYYLLPRLTIPMSTHSVGLQSRVQRRQGCGAFAAKRKANHHARHVSSHPLLAHAATYATGTGRFARAFCAFQ